MTDNRTPGTTDYSTMDYAAISVRAYEDMGGDAGGARIGSDKHKMLCMAMKDITTAAGALARGVRAARRELEDVERLAMGTVSVADGGYVARMPELRAAFDTARRTYAGMLRMALRG